MVVDEETTETVAVKLKDVEFGRDQTWVLKKLRVKKKVEYCLHDAEECGIISALRHLAEKILHSRSGSSAPNHDWANRCPPSVKTPG
jgi:uncharacterized protein (DUF4213/DUF364 family)